MKKKFGYSLEEELGFVLVDQPEVEEELKVYLVAEEVVMLKEAEHRLRELPLLHFLGQTLSSQECDGEIGKINICKSLQLRNSHREYSDSQRELPFLLPHHHFEDQKGSPR